VLAAGAAALAGAPAAAAQGAARATAREAAPPAGSPAALGDARQLVLVTGAGWDATAGTLRRYARAAPGAPWRAVGGATPVVLGRTGLAWGEGGGAPAASGEPAKREGDGRSPAGAFPLVAAFGFGDAAARRGRAPGLPYRAVGGGTVCVDDAASPLYNAVVDSADAGGARWASAERMRQVAGYRLGVVVGYNGAWVGGPSGDARAPDARAPNAARPRPGAGSCIVLHVWDGPGRPTEGCTAMTDAALAAVVDWLDPAARPALVQLPAVAAARVARAWGLPR
jgi:L,D-peptidoglycan transpeptidase YkuD (ErfK/YbiS/YcfS/YnhG family)